MPTPLNKFIYNGILVTAGTLGTVATAAIVSLHASYPSFPKPSGNLSIGCVKSNVSNKLTVQVFYPTVDTHSSRYARYMRPEAVDGIANWERSRIVKMGLSHLTCRHPRLYGVSILPKDGGWPIIIFSPGLGSNCELYSQMACDLASYGFVVIVLEHADGSGSYAIGQDDKPIYFIHPKNRYTREEVGKFRKPFLQHRVREIERVINDIRNNSNEIGTDLMPIIKHLNTSQILITGHSFGAATAVMAMQMLSNTFFGCILYDLWPFPLDDKVLKQGCPIPTLSIVSEQFAFNNEIQYTKFLLQNTEKTKLSVFIPGSLHQAFSDAPYWFPEWLGRKLNICGSNSVSATRKAAVHVSAKFIETISKRIDKSNRVDYKKDHKYLNSIVNSCNNLKYLAKL